ncbi:MAG: hypothetical protein JW937_02430 [Candidatus Omnitrophica bacterium]|nr:hypothetical protein [Candidatus Omnitrophota bacterium]
MNEDIAIHPGDPAPIVLHRTLGTNQRHATGPDESNASMLTHVAKKILDESGYSPKDIGRIICVCDPPDNIAPATAVKVQANIGAICPAFDMSMSCSGWLTALDLGLKCIATGEDKILVLASCFFGSRGPFRDVKHRAIFGDACGGLLLEQRHLDMFLATGQWTDGRNFHHIFAPHKWSQTPDEVPEEFRGYGYMNPEQRVFFDALSDILPPFCDNLMERAGVKKEDIDLFLLHYPSKPLFEHSLKVFPVPRKKMLTHFNRFANTIAAEMPVLLDEAIRTDRISPGDLVFMVTYGAGFTMAGAILRY